MSAPSYRLFETRDNVGFYLPSVAVSGALTYYSNLMQPNEEGLLGFTLEFTGTPTGTATLWVTDKPNPNLANDDDWEASATAITDPAGAAFKDKYSIPNTRCRFARIKYVNSAGSGTILGDALAGR